MKKLFAKLVIWALEKVGSDLETKILLTNAILKEVNALPIQSIMSFTKQGTLLLNGKPLDKDKALIIQESARITLHSQARRIIQDRVNWLAVNLAVHQGTTPETILFAKAAIWFGQEENKLYKQIAQEETELAGEQDL